MSRAPLAQGRRLFFLVPNHDHPLGVNFISLFRCLALSIFCSFTKSPSYLRLLVQLIFQRWVENAPSAEEVETPCVSPQTRSDDCDLATRASSALIVLVMVPVAWSVPPSTRRLGPTPAIPTMAPLLVVNGTRAYLPFQKCPKLTVTAATAGVRRRRRRDADRRCACFLPRRPARPGRGRAFRRGNAHLLA
jgi:hypothetical protein